MKRIILASVVLAFAACSPSPAPVVETAPPAETAVVAPLQIPAIAVLENNPGAFAGEPSKFVVRMLFQSKDGGWASIDPKCNDEACLAASAATWPPTAAWTIVHAGETKGTVNATTPKAWTRYVDVGTQDLDSTAIAPIVGTASQEFSDSGVDLYRPLVAVSVPAVNDPDGWKAGELAPADLAALQGAFTAQFADVSNCATEGGADAKPAKYVAADIKPSAAQASAKGWTIATANLTGYRCDGPWDGTAFAPQTFAISPDGKAQYLGEGLKLVDAGDFDGNGASEVLFAIQRGNTGGYDVFFNDFAGKATFAYNHH